MTAFEGYHGQHDDPDQHLNCPLCRVERERRAMTGTSKKVFTRFGTEVRIIGKDPRWPDVPWVAIETIDQGGTPTGETKWASVGDLKGNWPMEAERAPIAVYEEGRGPIILPTIVAAEPVAVLPDEWPFTARHGHGDEGDMGLTEDQNDD